MKSIAPLKGIYFRLSGDLPTDDDNNFSFLPFDTATSTDISSPNSANYLNRSATSTNASAITPSAAQSPNIAAVDLPVEKPEVIDSAKINKMFLVSLIKQMSIEIDSIIN